MVAFDRHMDATETKGMADYIINLVYNIYNILHMYIYLSFYPIGKMRGNSIFQVVSYSYLSL